ncbi:MAG: Arc family DNA-binding protein [Kiritimatiellae bacterium]|nr:Arc family DNA-binding protein [Kiritimatiellia bacterium]
MPSITLKDIPQAVHTALKQRARQHGRSLNKEALASLEAAVFPTKVDVDDLLQEIQRHRASLPGKLTDRLLRDATQVDRP